MPIIRKDTGGWLSVDEVKTGDLLEIMDEGEEVERDFQGQKKMALQLSVRIPNGDVRRLTLNATSRNKLIDFYGPDTKNWVGKEARVETAKQKIGANFKEVLYLTDPAHDLEGNLIS